MVTNCDLLLRENVDSSPDYERLRHRELADLPPVRRIRSVLGLRNVKCASGQVVQL